MLFAAVPSPSTRLEGHKAASRLARRSGKLSALKRGDYSGWSGDEMSGSSGRVEQSIKMRSSFIAHTFLTVGGEEEGWEGIGSRHTPLGRTAHMTLDMQQRAVPYTIVFVSSRTTAL